MTVPIANSMKIDTGLASNKKKGNKLLNNLMKLKTSLSSFNRSAKNLTSNKLKTIKSFCLIFHKKSLNLRKITQTVK